MSAYTIFKSNGTEDVFIPDASTGTGINSVSTSLKLVGRGYPNYGQVMAENFLHLLENFASPTSPANPTEGQLWYQTEVGGDTNVNQLMVFDGINWISATGYYHQDIDPRDTGTSINTGDMWFGTAENVLRVWNNGQWITIGPSISGESKTGIEAWTFTDSANPSLQYNCVLNWADGNVVSVLSSAPAFVPNTYPLGMDGFDTIYPGITVKKTNSQLGRVIAKADDSYKLNGIDSTSYLRKDVSTNAGEKITGKVVFETPNAAAQENRDGLIIRVAGTSPADYIQVYQTRPSDRNPGAAIFANNSPGGKIIFKANVSGNSTNVVTIDGKNLTVAGKHYIQSIEPASSTSTGALTVEGGVGIAGNVYANHYYSNGVPLNNIYWNGGEITSKLVINNTETSTVGLFSGALRVSGGATILRELYVGSTVTVYNTTTSLSTTTGALVIKDGGLGVGRDTTIGGSLTVNGQTAIVDLTANTVSITSTATSTSTTTGALIVVGGVGIRGDLFVGGKIVAQELDIQLTTVTTTLVVTDDIISTYNTTQSTSTSTGALKVAGGVGIGGNINVGGSGRFAGILGTNVTATTLTVTGQSTVVGLTATNFTATTVTVSGQTIVAGLTATNVTATSLTVSGPSNVAGVLATNVTATTLTVTGQSTVAGLTATNVTATTVTVTGNVNVGGYGKFTGTFDENTATIGVYVGVAGSPPASPRIVFAAGTGTNWQVDNYAGSLRVFQSTGIALTISGSTATLNKDLVITGSSNVAGLTASTLASTSLTVTGTIAQTAATVATLPAANVSQGMRSFVSNANTTTFYTVAAAGSPGFYVPVFCDGTDWRIG